MALSFRLALEADTAFFATVADDLFDKSIDRSRLREFLSDPRHHIAVANDDHVLVGFVSAVDYVHPDKQRQLWINEVGVASAYRRRGIASHLLALMLEHAKGIGCIEAWVLTDRGNEAANRLYQSSTPERPVEPSEQLMYSFNL